MRADPIGPTDVAQLRRFGDRIEPPCGPWWMRAGWQGFFLICRLTGGRPFLRGTGEFQSMGLLEKLFWVYKRHNTVVGHQLPAEVTVGADGWRSASEATRQGVIVATGELAPFSPGPEPATLVVSQGVTAAVEADVVVSNLEGAIGDLDLGTGAAPLLAVRRPDFEALRQAFGDSPMVVGLANNHVLDSTDEQIAETIAYLRGGKDTVVGVAAPDGQAAPVIQTVGEVPVGVVATTFASNRPTSDRQVALRVHPLHSRPTEALAALSNEIEEVRAGGAELVCLSVHWGHEFEWRPRREVQLLARQLAEAGADVIVGHHPHVIQPVEIHRCPDGRRVPIAYSLGNLVTTVMWPHLRLGLVARIEVARSAGRACVSGVSLVPTVLSRLEDRSDALVLETLAEAQQREQVRPEERDLMTGYADLVLEGARR